ncbi:MAG: glycoside hydrolase family 20 zincin-like fold domain-containing protein [bacterium]
MTSLPMRVCLFARIFLLLLVCQTLSAQPRPAAPAQLTIERDGVRVTFSAQNLMRIEADGVPFTESAALSVMKPGWKGIIYHTGPGTNPDNTLLSRARIMRGADGAVSATLPGRTPDNRFEGGLTVELLTNRTLRVTADARLTSDPEGVVEFKLGFVYSGWIAGRPFKAAVGGREKSGTIPATPRSPKLDESIVVSDFKSLIMDGRTGPIIVTPSGSAPFSLADYRLNNYSNDLPIFWLGALERSVKRDEQYSVSAAIQFPPPAGLKTQAGAAAVGGVAAAVDNALEPLEPADRIIPTPKKTQWSAGDLPLGNGMKISAAATSGSDVRPLREIQDELAAFARDAHNLKLEVQPPVISGGADSAEMKPASGIHFLLRPLALPEEGYRVTVSDSASAIAEAQTTAGLRNAMRTLCQLFRERGGGRITLRHCAIEDWPAFPYRGIHMFTGVKARDFQVKMMRDILGPLKINNLVYQCEYIRWDSHPELFNPKRGMEKADARAVIAEARRQGIEVTPLINTFGHSNWLFNGDVYRKLADNPDSPNTYDPSNPMVYRIAEDVYSEAIDLMRPRMFNIGHDEITMYGFPEKEVNRKVGMRELLQRDIMRYYEFLKKRGIRTMIWSDQFLAPGDAPSAAFAPDREEAKARRDALPRDIIIADWHYNPVPVEENVSIGLWSREGFDAVVCPWSKPKNILCFARAAANTRAALSATTAPAAGGRRPGEPLGVLQTTWAGFSNDWESFKNNQAQYAAYLLAAEAAWTGGTTEPSQVPFDHIEEFARLWQANDLPACGAPGWQADLSPIANIDLSAPELAKWLGYVNSSALASIPAGDARLWRFRFRIAGKAGSPRAVLLAGKFNPPALSGSDWPSRVLLPVGRKARAVAAAMACTTDGPAGSPLGDMVVRFDDGTSRVTSLKIGGNIFPLDDDSGNVLSPKVWQASATGQPPCAIHALVWTNPAPQKTIKSVEFVSARQGPAVMIFGVSGIGQPSRIKQ